MADEKKTKVIEDLTPEQDAKLEAYYQKWLKIGLTAKKTTKTMRERAEELIHQIYKAEKLTGLKEIKWAKSPMAGAKLCLALGDTKDNLTYSCGYGSQDANWLSFDDFMLNELGIEECAELKPFMELATLAGWWWPYENVCVISELPVVCQVNEEGSLHHDGGPSIGYSDGFELYHLNGIEVSEKIAKMPASKVTKKIILEEPNADVRRELIRKVGIEKTITLLGAKTIDKFEGYELLGVDYDEKGIRPYLRMNNPSLKKVVHIEGVAKDVSNVKAALCYRNGLIEYVAPRCLS